MPTAVFQFPGGRYHATAWGHHVNEGVVEWPPSPWRLIRALIASGYATQKWTTPPAPACSLIEKLASTLPIYRLPEASQAHTRHYMPLGSFDKGREKTTLVLDAWASVGAKPLAVRWNCALSDEEQETFNRLVEGIGYLGRSESWVTATGWDDDVELPGGTEATPCKSGDGLRQGWEQVSLMAPVPAAEYDRWRQQELPEPDGRLSREQRRKAEAAYPADLMACLQQDSAQWQAFGWSQPPGSQRVLYWRRSDSLSVSPHMASTELGVAEISAVLLALTTPSGTIASLPQRGRALPQGELLHRALISSAGRGRPVTCPELTGRDNAGVPLQGHRHAHILSLDLDGDRRIDHVLIYTPMGLGAAAQRALRTLKRTFSKNAAGPLTLAWAGSGDLDDLRQLPPPFDAAMLGVLGPRSGARVWRSATPFVAPRHLKRSGRSTLSGQVGAELAARGLPPALVAVLPWNDTNSDLRHAIRRRRRGSPQPPSDTGWMLQLTFDHGVTGPLALGYGCHFGLGLFEIEP